VMRQSGRLFLVLEGLLTPQCFRSAQFCSSLHSLCSFVGLSPYRQTEWKYALILQTSLLRIVGAKVRQVKKIHNKTPQHNAVH